MASLPIPLIHNAAPSNLVGHVNNIINTMNTGVLAGESWAGQLRRLASAAVNNNPVDCLPLRGSKPWQVLGGAWQSTTAVTIGQTVSNGGYMYLCTVPGTTAGSGGPTGTSSIASVGDGTARWVYWCGSVGDVLSNGGYVFKIITAGVPATTGTGPTPASLTDGSITWACIGEQTAPTLGIPSRSHNSSYSVRFPFTGVAANTRIPNTANIPYRLGGGIPTSNFLGNCFLSIGPNQAPTAGNLYSTYNTLGSRTTFDLEGTAFELYYHDNTHNPMQLIVDGRYVDYPFPSMGASGYEQYIIVDFTNLLAYDGYAPGTGRNLHRVTIESTANAFLEVSVQATDNISLPVFEDDFTVAVLGDSHSVSTNCPSVPDCYAYKMMHILGWPDVSNIGIGGTGFIQNNGNTVPNYIGHAVADMTALNAYRPLKLIVIQISQNDSSYVGAQLQAAALLLFQTVRAAFPTIPIWVLGTTVGGSITYAQQLSVEQSVIPAVAQQQAAGDNLIFFTPFVTLPYGPGITGTGAVSAPTGSGTSDNDIGLLDTVHMAPKGHLIYARTLAKQFLNLIRNIP